MASKERFLNVHATAMKKPELLLIDDQPVIRITLTHLFQNSYTIHTAECGEQALQLLQVLVPEIILLDVGLPDIDGLEICRLIKNSPAHSHSKVLLLSGEDEAWLQKAAEEVRADAYSAKNFSPEVLLNQVKALLAQ